MKKIVRASFLVLGFLFASASAFASDEHAGADNSAAHGHGHVPHLSDVNWVDGIFSREEGTPVPLIALLLNTAVLAFLIGRFGGPAMRDGLQARQRRILSDVDAAAAMKREAEGQLAEYEARLKSLQAETEEIRRSMVETAELERKRLLAEAETQRLSMIKDAEERLVHELRVQRESLIRETIAGAVQLAQVSLQRDSGVLGGEHLAAQLLASVGDTAKSTEVRS